jgi:hypothetical protein
MKSLEKTGFLLLHHSIGSGAELDAVGTHFAPDREARNGVFYGLVSGFCGKNFGFCNFWSLGKKLFGFRK